jgi:hypothetical protein
VNWWIVTFLLAGVAFGLATYSRRHLYNEGPTRAAGAGPRDPLDGRLMWLLLCSCLWPLFVLTRVYTRSRVHGRR